MFRKNDTDANQPEEGADGSLGFSAWGSGLSSFRNKLQEQTQDFANKVVTAAQLEVTPTQTPPLGAANNPTATVVSIPPVQKKKDSDVSSSEKQPVDKNQSLSSRNPEDISKDELMEILSKMNKRVKQLNIMKLQLTEKLEKSLEDKEKIKNLIVNEILTEIDIEEARFKKENQDELELFRNAWRAADERNSLMLQQLQNEFKVMTMKKDAELKKTQTNNSNYEQDIEEIHSSYQTEIKKMKETHNSTKDLHELSLNVENKLRNEKEIWNEQKKEMLENHEQTLVELKEKQKRIDEMEAQITERENEKKNVKAQMNLKLETSNSEMDDYRKKLESYESLTEKLKDNLSKLELTKEELVKKHSLELNETRSNLNNKMSKLENILRAELHQVEKQYKEEKEDILQIEKSKRENFEKDTIVKLQEKEEEYNKNFDSFRQKSRSFVLKLKDDHSSNVSKLLEEKEEAKRKHEESLKMQRDEYEIKFQMTQESKNNSDSEEALKKLSSDYETLIKKKEESFHQIKNDLHHENKALLNKHSELENNLSKMQQNLKEERMEFVKKNEVQERKHQQEMETIVTEKETTLANLLEEKKTKASVEENLNVVQKKYENLKDEILFEKKNSNHSLEKIKNLNKSCKDLSIEKSQIENGYEKIKQLYEGAFTQSNEQKSKLVQLVDALKKKQVLLKKNENAIEELNKQQELNAKKLEEKIAENEKLEEDLNKLIHSEKKNQEKVKNKLEDAEEQLQSTITKKEKEYSTQYNNLRQTYQTKLDSIRQNHDSFVKKIKLENSEELKKLKIEFENQKEAEKKKLFEILKVSFEEKAAEKEEVHLGEVKKIQEEKNSILKKSKAYFEKEVNELKSEHTKVLQEKDSKHKEVSTNSEKNVQSLQKERAELFSNYQKMSQRELSLKKSQDKILKQLDESNIFNTEATSSLLEEQDKLKNENQSLQSQNNKLLQDLSSKSNKVEELQHKLNALQENLNSVLVEKNELDEKLRLAEKQEEKLKQSENDLGVLRQEVSKLKLDQTKKAGIVSRLQAEKDSNDRKHGQRTALVGMLEAQLVELNEAHDDAKAKLEAALYDLSLRDDTIEDLKQELEKTQKTLEKKKSEPPVVKTVEELPGKKIKMIEALQKEVMSIQQQMARKSAAAQRLLQEREVECDNLRSQNKKLQDEVDFSTLSDKRIIELAAKQSNRDVKAVTEIEIRDKILHNLKSSLIKSDCNLAEVEYNYQQVYDHVEELSRLHRREDINVDYLKSIIVQFLSKPPGSSERSSLLPVIATLLQFDNNDYKAIELGKQKVSWLWGQVIPTLISAPEEEETPKTSLDPLYEQESASLLPQSNSIEGYAAS